jgi:malonate-semialdehyde dehydrogenase (acetylating)/methylmalonate-semialdehyde dehydrogenase
MTKQLQNFINGKWVQSQGSEYLDVVNPATSEVMTQVPAGNSNDLDLAANAASEASSLWRNTPAGERVQYLFKMKTILENNSNEIAEICTNESGKTFAESKAEIVRALENIEVACGIPILMQSEFSEDIAKGIDAF